MQVMGNLLKYTCAKIIGIGLKKRVLLSLLFSYMALVSYWLFFFQSFLSIVGWGKFNCT